MDWDKSISYQSSPWQLTYQNIRVNWHTKTSVATDIPKQPWQLSYQNGPGNCCTKTALAIVISKCPGNCHTKNGPTVVPKRPWQLSYQNGSGNCHTKTAVMKVLRKLLLFHDKMHLTVWYQNEPDIYYLWQNSVVLYHGKINLWYVMNIFLTYAMEKQL